MTLRLRFQPFIQSPLLQGMIQQQCIHCSVSVETGSICYTDYMIISYYGDGGYKIGEESVKGGYRSDITLYKDDGW